MFSFLKPPSACFHLRINSFPKVMKCWCNLISLVALKHLCYGPYVHPLHLVWQVIIIQSKDGYEILSNMLFVYFLLPPSQKDSIVSLVRLSQKDLIISLKGNFLTPLLPSNLQLPFSTQKVTFVLCDIFTQLPSSLQPSLISVPGQMLETFWDGGSSL